MATEPIDLSPLLLTEREAALFLRLAPQTLSNWRHQDRGPSYSKCGGKVLYSREQLLAFVKANERTSTTTPAA